MTKIFLIGQDRIGWSIDQDYKSWTRLLRQVPSVKSLKTPLGVDIILCVWWSKLKLAKLVKALNFNRPKIIAIVTSDITTQTFLKKPHIDDVDLWLCFNDRQGSVLQSLGLPFLKFPLLRNHHDLDPSKALAHKLWSKKIKSLEQVGPDDFVIGNFMRDGSVDLSKPREEKNPSLFVEICRGLIDKGVPVLVLLAGPRRQFIINELITRGVRFIYFGEQTPTDDIQINTLPSQIIGFLYLYVDLSIITSTAEGGPKTILDGCITNTPVISTDVGIATDYLATEAVMASKHEFIATAARIYKDRLFKDYLIDYQQKQFQSRNDEPVLITKFQNVLSRLK